MSPGAEKTAKKKELVLIGAAAGLAAAFFIARAVFGPFHARLSALGREVALGEAKLGHGIGLIAYQEAITREYAHYASYFSLRNLSDEESVANFLKEIEKTSRASGLVVLDMKPQKEMKEDKFSKQYTINLRAEGNMEELIAFLYALHTSPLLFGVEKMTLAPKAEDSPDLSIVMAIAGMSFL